MYGQEDFYNEIGPRNSRRKNYDEYSQSQSVSQQNGYYQNEYNQGFQGTQTIPNLFSMTQSVNSSGQFRKGTFKRATKISRLNNQTFQAQQPQSTPRNTYNFHRSEKRNDPSPEYDDYFERENELFPANEEKKPPVQQELGIVGPRDSIPKEVVESSQKRIEEREGPYLKYQKNLVNYNGFQPTTPFPKSLYEEEKIPDENYMIGEYRFEGKTVNVFTGEDYVLPGKEPKDEEELQYDYNKVFRIKNRYKTMNNGKEAEFIEVEKDSYNGENEEELEKASNIRKRLSNDKFSSYIFDQINNLRKNPESFIEKIEKAKENIGTTSDGRLVYVGDEVKVALHEGEAAFDEAINDLKNTEPMGELQLDPLITVKAKTNDDLLNKKFLEEKVNEKGDNGIFVNSYWKEIIKEKETAFLLMVVDDRENKDNNKNKEEGEENEKKRGKRQDLLDPNMKRIGISSKATSNGRYFHSYITLSK